MATTARTHVEEEPVKTLRFCPWVLREEFTASFREVKKDVPGFEKMKGLVRWAKKSFRCPRAGGRG